MKKLEYLFELAEILNNQNNFDEMLRIVSSKTSAIFNSDITSILMINPSSQETYKTVYKKEIKIKNEQYSILQSIIIGWVIINKKPILVSDIKTDVRFKENLFNSFPIKSIICSPLNNNDTKIGYIILMNKNDKDSFEENDLMYLQKIAIISAPFINNAQKIQEFFNLPVTQNILVNKYKSVGLLGKSNSFIELLQGIEAASKCDVRVVIEGETGTGKELIVRAIHNFSNRSGFPFIAIDCGAISNNLIESELFGHVKGAFTGANQDHTGLIVQANKGTLFLDEICNLSYEMQAKLLRVLQEGEVRPVGSIKVIKVDVRFIAATSVPLHTLVVNKQFREDLFFRLMVYPIKVPSLNERKTDIPIIANFFLLKFSKEQNKKAEFFHKKILDYIKNKNWSGNIRELENFVEHIVTIVPFNIEVIEIEYLSPKIQEDIRTYTESTNNRKIISLTVELENYEKKIIKKSLEENEWNQSQTARSLDIPEQTLRYKMRKLNIEKL
ncbi:MAG: sigma-54-dependent Fis family transcriptional regulator [Ignavibacteriae bacterium]|nr:sigma-54-dependent Fis family transcriptional regulator [Ignavibacteriota bacterium]